MNKFELTFDELVLLDISLRAKAREYGRKHHKMPSEHLKTRLDIMKSLIRKAKTLRADAYPTKLFA